MEAKYKLEGGWVVQVHPVHGRRNLIQADGHGQLVWVGEVAGSLLVFDRWNCMGYKDGSLDVYDPETLDLRLHLTLDLDAVLPIGFYGDKLFVLCETRFTESTWRAWRLSDWVEVAAPAIEDEEVRSLHEALVCHTDLP